MKKKAIIIGGGIAGLTAGSVLAKNGLDVTIVEQAPSVGGFSRQFANKSGYHFNVGTDILSGFGYGEVFHWLFKELNLGAPLAPKGGIAEPLSPSLQVILPEHRINILSKRQEMADELEREFPGKSKQIIGIYHKMDRLEELIFSSLPERHPYSMANRCAQKQASIFLKPNTRLKALFNAERSLSELIGKQSQEIKDFFSIQTFPLIVENRHPLPLTTASVLIGRTKRGSYKIKGGFGVLVDKLKDSIIDMGGKIATNTTCENIIIRKNRVYGIKGMEGDTPIELDANYVMASLPFYQINSRLLQKGILSNYSTKKSRPPKMESFVPFTLFIGADSKVIPEPMTERVLVQDAEKTNNIIHIHLNPDNDTKYAPDGKRTLTVTSWMPQREGENISETNKNEKAKDIIAKLEGCIPFLSEHIDSCNIIDYNFYKNISGKEGVSRYIGNRHLYSLPKPKAKTPINGLYSIDDSASLFYSSACTAKTAIMAAEYLLKRI